MPLGRKGNERVVDGADDEVATARELDQPQVVLRSQHEDRLPQPGDGAGSDLTLLSVGAGNRVRTL